ncbi:MAG: hypothetical protein AAGE01_08975 [Pseudomonadota bacterium]
MSDMTGQPQRAAGIDSITGFQVLGPFGSGTCLMFNYMQQLYAVPGSYDGCCWKHSLPPRYRTVVNRRSRPFKPDFDAWRTVQFIVMARSPYYWISSLLERAYEVDFDTPSRKRRDRLFSALSIHGRSFPHVMALWNAYYRAYPRWLVPRAPVRTVRLEDLVADPRRVLEGLGRLPRDESVDRDALIDRIDATPAKVHGEACVAGDEARARYTEANVPRYFAPDELEFINDGLDPELLRRLGYRRIEPDPSRIWTTPAIGAA